jgi:hypothetical protein
LWGGHPARRVNMALVSPTPQELIGYFLFESPLAERNVPFQACVRYALTVITIPPIRRIYANVVDTGADKNCLMSELTAQIPQIILSS